MISIRLFGVTCSVNEWKFRNSAILVVEVPAEEPELDDPALCEI